MFTIGENSHFKSKDIRSLSDKRSLIFDRLMATDKRNVAISLPLLGDSWQVWQSKKRVVQETHRLPSLANLISFAMHPVSACANLY
jgi:hypothetical protein